MTITGLTDLIARADKRQKGCTVCFMSIHVPPNAGTYGVITYGLRESKRIFHSQEELGDILERLSRP